MNAPPIWIDSGSSTPTSINYVDPQEKEKLQAINDNKVPQGSTLNRGVILAADTLNVPIESWGLQYEPSEKGRPTLLPLFRTRYVEGGPAEDLSISFYTELRNRLPPELKRSLEIDEQRTFNQRDQNLIAFDQGLHFEANLLAIAQKISQPPLDPEGTRIRTDQYVALPETVRQNLIAFGDLVLAKLDHQLQAIGPNDPSYDLFLRSFNLLKEARALLS